MRAPFLVSVIVGVWMVHPAPAQTSGWDFSSKPPVTKESPPTPQRKTTSQETAVGKKTAASGGTHPAAAPHVPSAWVRLVWEHAGAPSDAASIAPRGWISLDWSDASPPSTTIAPTTDAAPLGTVPAPRSIEDVDGHVTRTAPANNDPTHRSAAE